MSAASGRIIAVPVLASRDQPPFAASAMDGYAVRSADAPGMLEVVGESVAGRGYSGLLQTEQAIRISTGAPVPDGADAIAIQEEVRRFGNRIETPGVTPRKFIRPQGGDFKSGQKLLPANQILDGVGLALAAASGAKELKVARLPRVAILCCGDELVEPGDSPGSHQIYDSASFGLKGLIESWGAAAQRLAIQRDDIDTIAHAAQVGLAQNDLLIVIGGASVGDHDHARAALLHLDLEIVLAGVAVRPGRPTWFGIAPQGPVLGLPGNPASALVCAYLFLKPLVAKLQGWTLKEGFQRAKLLSALPANGPREHYLRSRVSIDAEARQTATAFEDQDSSLLSVFAAANALIRLPPNAPRSDAGCLVDILPLGRL